MDKKASCLVYYGKEAIEISERVLIKMMITNGCID